MKLAAIIIISALTVPAIVFAQNAPAAEWDTVKAVYKQRADVTKHKQAAQMAQALSAKYPSDRDAALFCAMVSYYAAHRLSDKEKKLVAGEGVKCAQRVLEKNKKDYDGRYWWAMTTFKSKEGEGINAALKKAGEIKTFLEQMIKDQPNRYEAYMLLGALYRDLPSVISWGDSKKAVELLEKCVSLAPNDPEALLELGAAYVGVGKKDEARKTYNKCINESKAPKDREWETEDAKRYAREQLKKL